MIIILMTRSEANSLVVELPYFDMTVDPRMISRWMRGYKFRCSVKGTTLTVTSIDEDEGWHSYFYLRAYLPTEVIPDFTSTVYTCWGLKDERAPEGTTELNVHPSVTIIKPGAFYGCKSLVRVTIPDTVTHIEESAFGDCDSLRTIRLSTNLIVIGELAFDGCKSLQEVFFPPTITHIGNWAFRNCK